MSARLSRVLLVLVVMLTLLGIAFRLGSAGMASPYAEGATERRLADFLAGQGFPAPVLVSYSRDGGIRGLQMALPGCDGNLQMLVSPHGDEFVAMWEGRSATVGYTTTYLYGQRHYTDFPTLPFWWATMKAALAHKLHLSNQALAGDVVALAYPHGCATAETIPWTDFR